MHVIITTRYRCTLLSGSKIYRPLLANYSTSAAVIQRSVERFVGVSKLLSSGNNLTFACNDDVMCS